MLNGSEVPSIETIIDAPRYFPLANGRYEVKPGLLPLETDLGNGTDQQVFQLDSSFSHYYLIKQQARTERLSKYYCNTDSKLSSAVARWMIDRLITEHPQQFQMRSQDGSILMYCALTGETLEFDTTGQLLASRASRSALDTPLYVSAIDALASQVQEDICVIARAADHSNRLAIVHLCFPNHWGAEAKIGQDFAVVHHPVAEMEKINRRAAAIVSTMITRPPMVRFAWGLSTDTRLNHHPDNQCHQRQFDPHQPRLFLRIERQVIWGLPAIEAAVFTIRTFFRDCAVLQQAERLCLLSALQSMTPASLSYKGLADSKAAIIAWLEAGLA